MNNTGTEIRICLAGPLSVTAPDGEDLTPVGAKNQGLLALLALSSGMSRPRRWLEDKLWSTFGPEQAGANLRQALSKLRSALGPYSQVLIADRSSVALDRKRVRVDVIAHEFRIEPGQELLEGLDVRDPEFEEWLRVERSRFQARIDAATPSRPKGLLIQCRTGAATGGPQIVADILANRIGENIAEQVRAWRVSAPHVVAHGAEPGDLDIACDLIEVETGLNAFIKVVHAPTGRVLYTKLQPIPSVEAVIRADRAIGAAIFEAADRTLGHLPLAIDNARPEARATALARLALYRMFTFEPDALREAFSLLDQAQELDDSGIYVAWRALIRTIQKIELFERDLDALLEETRTLNQHALERAADNPLVQAIVAQVRVMAFADAAGGIDLAEQSVERNPAGGFGWLSLSVSRGLAGRQRDAIVSAHHARDIARFSPFRHWWDMNHCVVCVACGEIDLAIEAAESAARAAPSFRPAHRHLLALYAHKGEFEKSQAVAARLAKIEPDFTLDRFVRDDGYPVRTLRKQGLLAPLTALL
jgi:tetratricopeptide (TPR) repeat protein